MGPQGRRLAAADEANLVLDSAGQVNVFLIAGLLEPGGFVDPDGTADLRVLRAAVRERIGGLPRLRQVVVGAGLRHRWAPAQPDLEQHVRVTAAVEGVAGFERLCGELMDTPVALDRPLWELLIVPGAAAGGVGIVLRIHHAVADGMAAVAIAHRLFDPADPGEAPAGPASAPEGPASAPARPASAPARPASAPAGPASPPETRPQRRRDPRRVLRALSVGLRRTRLTLTGREVGSTMLLGPRSPSRGVAFIDVDLAALKAFARPRGATVNDALLAGVAAGYRAALLAAGEPVPARLPVSIPVALERRGTPGNQVGVMLVRLPLQAQAPAERVRLIADQTRAEKSSARGQRTFELMRGPVGASIMNRVARRQHLIAGFVTNVPGPAHRLRLGGATVVAIWPVGVLAGNVRLGVAAVSYAGRLSCSIHFDAAHVPGAVFARAMADELAHFSD